MAPEGLTGGGGSRQGETRGINGRGKDQDRVAPGGLTEGRGFGQGGTRGINGGGIKTGWNQRD